MPGQGQLNDMRRHRVELLRKEGAALEKAVEMSKAAASPETVAAAMRVAQDLVAERNRLTREVRDLEWKLAKLRGCFSPSRSIPG